MVKNAVLHAFFRLAAHEAEPGKDVEALLEWAVFRPNEELRRLGAYVKGSDAAVDQAFEKKPHLDLFLRQQIGELTECSKSVAFMQALVAS